MTKSQPQPKDTAHHLDSGVSSDALVRFEFETLLKEYEICNMRVIREVEADEKAFEYNMVGISAAVAAASLTINLKAYSLLLLLPIPFYLLTWYLAKRGMISANLIQYIGDILGPRLDTIIQEAGSGQEIISRPFPFVTWEKFSWSKLGQNPFYMFPSSMTQIGRAILQLLVAAMLVIAYLVFRSTDPAYISSYLDNILIWINIVAGVLSVLSLVISSFFWLSKSKRRI